MFEFLQHICVVLSQPTATVPEVSTKIGTIVKDNGGNLNIVVQPSDPLFKRADVVREYNSQEVVYVELELANSKHLTVKELKRLFGNEYRQGTRRDWNTPANIIFYVEMPNASHNCAIIADMKPDVEKVEDSTEVITVGIRRDIKVK